MGREETALPPGGGAHEVASTEMWTSTIAWGASSRGSSPLASELSEAAGPRTVRRSRRWSGHGDSPRAAAVRGHRSLKGNAITVSGAYTPSKARTASAAVAEDSPQPSSDSWASLGGRLRAGPGC